MTEKASGNRYSQSEEIANSVTHGLGFMLSVAACSVLVVLAAQRGTPWHVVGVAIFGASLILLYAASTIYHALTHRKAKRVFKFLDYSAIYVLIAGTYTPFTLVTLRGGWGWSLFGIAWGLAIAGAVVEVVTKRRFKAVSLAFYLGMGWLLMIAIKPLVSSLDTRGLLLLLAGGVAYTGGSALYVWGRFRYHHAVWHLLVLIGSTCHFLAVLFSVIPSS
ncbi:MAG: hemolysin III family protein [Gemmatimonadales bacterium]|nr:hemolysin III family protein [Gemmatimonadales bacterium]